MNHDLQFSAHATMKLYSVIWFAGALSTYSSL